MNNQEVHIARPDGTIIMTQGAFAGLRTKIMGGTTLKSNVVTIVHHDPTIPYIFDPSYAVIPPPNAAAAAAQMLQNPNPVKEEIKVIKAETFISKTPTEANPWADLQIDIEDEDVEVVADVIEERELTAAEANASNDMTSDELIEMLMTRDVASASMTVEEFNALKLSKRQLWRLYEQVIGQTVNKPNVQIAIQHVLKKANSSPANYSRVTMAIKRVREQ